MHVVYVHHTRLYHKPLSTLVSKNSTCTSTCTHTFNNMHTRLQQHTIQRRKFRDTPHLQKHYGVDAPVVAEALSTCTAGCITILHASTQCMQATTAINAVKLQLCVLKWNSRCRLCTQILSNTLVHAQSGHMPDSTCY